MSVYQTYINAMNSKIQREISHRNPFLFKHISNLKVLLVATCVYAKTMHVVNMLNRFSSEVRPFMHSSFVSNALVQVCYVYGLLFLQNMDQFEDIGPSVVMASPGMMQSGLSRELFENWCTDRRNGTIIAGYCVEGTLAKVHYEGWQLHNR